MLCIDIGGCEALNQHSLYTEGLQILGVKLKVIFSAKDVGEWVHSCFYAAQEPTPCHCKGRSVPVPGILPSQSD